MKLGTTPSIASHVIKLYGATRKSEDNGRSGHPRILNENDCYLDDWCKHDSIVMQQNVKVLLEVSNITSSPNTIRITPKCKGLQFVVKKKKLLLLDHHQQVRHEWTKRTPSLDKE